MEWGSLVWTLETIIIAPRHRLFPASPPSPCFREMSILFNLISQWHKTSSICFCAQETSGVGGLIENICSFQATFEVILIIESMGSLNCCRLDFHLVFFVSLLPGELSMTMRNEKAVLSKNRQLFAGKFSFLSVAFVELIELFRTLYRGFFRCSFLFCAHLWGRASSIRWFERWLFRCYLYLRWGTSWNAVLG